MKKVIIVEVAVLVALLLVALMVSGGQGEKPQPTVPVETTTAPTETTVPPVTTPAIDWMVFPEDRELVAKQYFVYADGDFATISGSRTERIYPASVTKLFTAYVALQYLDEDDTIVVGDALTMVVPGSSVAGLKKGDSITVGKLVEAMLLPSGNDAAYALAAEVGRMIAGDNSLHVSLAAQKFVERMNQIAAEEGMTGTNFANPDGIHKDSHYTTPEDLVKMATLALQEEAILRYAAVSADPEPFGAGDGREGWKNTNALVDKTSVYYCPIAIGLKTGQTPAAGSCLLSAFRYNDTTVIIGVFGCPKEDDRFQDTLQLLNDLLQ
jgi:D-alanyl-D-alanine carboxypeptidase (penicillin-binding protein 5/6)